MMGKSTYPEIFSAEALHVHFCNLALTEYSGKVGGSPWPVFSGGVYLITVVVVVSVNILTNEKFGFVKEIIK